MSTSQPRQRWACPECGAALEADVRQCWLCYREVEPVALAATAAPPTGTDRPLSAAKAADDATPFAAGFTPHYERQAYFQFTISSMLLLTTLVAVLCGVGSMEPGLGIANLRHRTVLTVHAFGPSPAMHWSSRTTFRGPPSRPVDQSWGGPHLARNLGIRRPSEKIAGGLRLDTRRDGFADAHCLIPTGNSNAAN